MTVDGKLLAVQEKVLLTIPTLEEENEENNEKYWPTMIQTRHPNTSRTQSAKSFET
jgi:hypothetical protein